VTSSLPLQGIRVVEFTHAVMGPSCGLILADLGAEVIRVEPPSGDHTRDLPGFGAGYFTFFNRNKVSFAVDLKSSDGLQAAMELIASADVLVENFAPGTMDRLHLGAERLRSHFPRLVYCSLKGFLPGPYAKRHAMDEVVQMMGGLAYMTGPTGRPLRAGSSVVDITGGMFGAIGILSALFEREGTGVGKHVQAALFETTAFLMGQHMAYGAITQTPVPPMPERVSAWSVYRTFTTRDGRLVFIGIVSDKHWWRFCEAFGRSDFIDDPTLSTNHQRIAARDRLMPELEAMIAKYTCAEVMDRCEVATVPCAPVATPEDLFTDRHLVESGGLVETHLPKGGTCNLPKLPLALNDVDLGVRHQPPSVGGSTSAILRELGISEDRIEKMFELGIIAGSRTVSSQEIISRQ
jgi:crotonobetainyl-CoA:carnitine CoA-transferase CaiB-like acyl-CoA transferase